MKIDKVVMTKKNRRRLVRLISFLLCIIVLGVGGIYVANKHYEHVKAEKAKALQIEKRKKEEAAIKKAEKEKQKKIEKKFFLKNRNSYKNRIVEGKKVNVDGVEASISDVLAKAAYGKVVVCVGLNEVGWGNVDRFLESYGQLVDQIKAAQPNARIYLQSILPVSAKKSASQTVFTNSNIIAYNEGIVRLAAAKNVDFINPSAPLIDGTGALLTEASSDGIHLSAAYCKIWAQSIAEIISPKVLVKQVDEAQESQAGAVAN